MALNATADVQKICDEIKPHAEKKVGKKFDVFTAKSYKKQDGAGIIYFIKVHVGGEVYVHLHVRKFPSRGGGILQLQGIQTPKTQQDPLESF